MFDQAQEDFVQLKKVLAEGTSPVYLWIGAGLSQDAGFPSWSQLRENLINRGRKWLQPQFGLSTRDHKLKLLDVAEEDSNYWKAFDRICEAIGPTVYEQFIVSEFELASKCKIPKTYSGILGLKNIRGVITTNIDRLVTRTLGEICGMTPKEFTGFECGDYMHVLGQAEFFVLNLHGLVEKCSSWVMRKAELDSLMGNNAYNVFVQTLFSSGTVIFVGVNPIDEAVRVHLERTRNRSGMPGTLPLYWITDNTTDVAIDFENKYNIRRILYSADENHKELKEVVRLLNEGRSYDENLDPEFINVTPINKSVRNFDKLNFEKLSAEEARELLNKKASEILRSGDAEKYIKYEKFLNQYKRQIHAAWYVEPNEQLFGLTINNEIDEGAFGRVFQASDRKGNLHAVKVLKVDVMRKPEYLQSFRRGVRAMKILSDKNLPGIVKFEAASEIPALVQMELVDGENLYEAVKQRRVTTWREKMRILTDVGRIIKSAHALPERILHRDIRPQNIMLRDFYNSERPEVCVLDFDLAFHKDANEVSVPMGLGNGYTAPEQIDRSGKYGLTRSSRVDSYGFAMLCYFVITGREPRPGQGMMNGWTETIYQDVCAHSCREWQSLPYRMAKIIKTCTEPDQRKRWDLYQIYSYLDALNKVLLNPDSMTMPDLIRDELVYSVALPLKCAKIVRVDMDGQMVFTRPTGTCYRFGFENRSIRATISWHHAGEREFCRVRKTLNDRACALINKLKNADFRESEMHFDGGGVIVETSFDFHPFRARVLQKFAGLLCEYDIAPHKDY